MKSSKRLNKDELIKRFDRLMKNNKGGLVEFPLNYVQNHLLRVHLLPSPSIECLNQSRIFFGL